MLADGEDDEDVDLSDSDDDATWTPFKEKESKEGGKDGKVDGGAHANGPKKRPNYMDDLDDDDDEDDDEDDEDSDEDVAAPSSSKKSRPVVHQPAASAKASSAHQGSGRVSVGTVTQLVPEGGEYKTGDFVMLTSDADKDSAPIWR